MPLQALIGMALAAIGMSVFVGIVCFALQVENHSEGEN